VHFKTTETMETIPDMSFIFHIYVFVSYPKSNIAARAK
jgi:hypothetical protein